MNMKLRSKRWTSIWRFLFRDDDGETERERERIWWFPEFNCLCSLSLDLLGAENPYISLLSLQTAICFVRGKDLWYMSICSRLLSLCRCQWHVSITAMSCAILATAGWTICQKFALKILCDVVLCIMRVIMCDYSYSIYAIIAIVYSFVM